MPSNKRSAKSEPQTGRDRLVETARRLFTKAGAANVGINEVIDTAGVARMTLYNNFPSKEALTVAVYQEMAEGALARIDALIATHGSEEERIAALFEQFGKRVREPGFRGCSFIHASFQEQDPHGAVFAVVQAYKRALRERVRQALDAGRRNRDELADQIVILLDGAVTEAYIKGVSDPMRSGRDAALALLGIEEAARRTIRRR